MTVAFGVIMVGLDSTVVAIANPYIASGLHASLADLQWITNSYLLALAVLLIVGGRLGNRYGRRSSSSSGSSASPPRRWASGPSGPSGA